MGFCLILSLTILPLPSASHPSHVDLIKKYRWTFALSRPSSHHNFIHRSPTANSLYQHPATMISQRVVVLSALVALFALLSAADAQQLRANNKRVLIEQEVSSSQIQTLRPAVFVQVRRTHDVLKVPFALICRHTVCHNRIALYKCASTLHRTNSATTVNRFAPTYCSWYLILSCSLTSNSLLL